MTSALQINVAGLPPSSTRLCPARWGTPLDPAERDAEDVAKFGEDSDMGRAEQPEEICTAYVFVASPVTASDISGIVLPVMGGPHGCRHSVFRQEKQSKTTS